MSISRYVPLLFLCLTAAPVQAFASTCNSIPISSADLEISSPTFFAAGSAVDSAIVSGVQNAPVNPTPEPATFALLGGALIVVARLRRRR